MTAGFARVFWGGVTALAVLWPGRLLSPLDGIPLDGRLEAVVQGVAFPILWWLYPGFLRKAWGRGLVISLLIWKLATALALTQGGWCARFSTQTLPVEEGSRIQRSWDPRTDWHRSIPRCSAIIARPYPTLADFPVWFVNLFDKTGRPPQETFAMEIDGYFTVTKRGTLSLSIGQGVRLKGSVGTAAIISDGTDTPEVSLEPGVHPRLSYRCTTGARTSADACRVWLRPCLLLLP